MCSFQFCNVTETLYYVISIVHKVPLTIQQVGSLDRNIQKPKRLQTSVKATAICICILNEFCYFSGRNRLSLSGTESSLTALQLYQPTAQYIQNSIITYCTAAVRNNSTVHTEQYLHLLHCSCTNKQRGTYRTVSSLTALQLYEQTAQYIQNSIITYCTAAVQTNSAVHTEQYNHLLHSSCTN